jgi:hypothetical protein
MTAMPEGGIFRDAVPLSLDLSALCEVCEVCEVLDKKIKLSRRLADCGRGYWRRRRRNKTWL